MHPLIEYYRKWLKTNPACVIPDDVRARRQLKHVHRLVSEGKLAASQHRALEQAGVPLKPEMVATRQQYEKFMAYIEEAWLFREIRGHTEVRQREAGRFKALGKWMDNLRARGPESVDDWRAQLIMQHLPDFKWDLQREGLSQFNRYLIEMRRYVERNGELPTGELADEENPLLPGWVEEQMKRFREGMMTPEQQLLFGECLDGLQAHMKGAPWAGQHDVGTGRPGGSAVSSPHI